MSSSDAQQRAFERFVRGRRRSSQASSTTAPPAADTEYGWAWYGGHARHALSEPTRRSSVRRNPASATENIPSTSRLPRDLVAGGRVVQLHAQSPTLRERPCRGSTSRATRRATGRWVPTIRSPGLTPSRADGRGSPAGGHTERVLRGADVLEETSPGGIRYAAGLTPPRIVTGDPHGACPEVSRRPFATGAAGRAPDASRCRARAPRFSSLPSGSPAEPGDGRSAPPLPRGPALSSGSSSRIRSAASGSRFAPAQSARA